MNDGIKLGDTEVRSEGLRREMFFDRGLGRLRPIGEPPIISSARLSWSGLLLEHQRVHSFDSRDVIWLNNVVVLHLNHALTFEWKEGSRYIPKRVQPGQISLRPAQLTCSARSKELSEFVLLSIEPAFMELIRGESFGDGEFEMALAHGIEDPFIKGVCLALKREAEQGGTSGKLYSESLGTSLAMHLAQNYDVRNGSAPFASAKPTARFVRQAKEFIEARLHADISLREIAEAVGLSVFHFARQFKLAVGCSPHQYVIKRRVQRARQLLMRGDRSITAIAMDVGFADQSHLTRQFKRYCGITPKVFANQYGPRRKLAS